ncbi:MAG: hypothetical protein LBJ15_23725 [Comamonas sp.]|uniref:hypothetical protein n=1 Tax=Comamonas sp. TaxID=34028 RepID=UPI0028215D24|nr:hypothetical protein [Comamonas sp.]MDR0216997.1 hypothetical protein [Comamonas sp.]MDR2299432.1 hypothetical protein [Comamonas sp.]
MLLPWLLVPRAFLLVGVLLLLLTGLAGLLAWLALAGALLLLLLLVLLVRAVLLVRLLRHFLHSFRLVISKPGWLAVGSWSPTHGKPFCRKTRRNAELCELTAIT